jgi:hypothetical protein
VMPALMRCTQEEWSRAGVRRASGAVDEDGDRGGFEVVSEGGVADYVKSVGGGGFVSNERRRKTENWAGNRQIEGGKWAAWYIITVTRQAWG